MKKTLIINLHFFKKDLNSFAKVWKTSYSINTCPNFFFSQTFLSSSHSWEWYTPNDAVDNCLYNEMWIIRREEITWRVKSSYFTFYFSPLLSLNSILRLLHLPFSHFISFISTIHLWRLRFSRRCRLWGKKLTIFSHFSTFLSATSPSTFHIDEAVFFSRNEFFMFWRQRQVL